MPARSPLPAEVKSYLDLQRHVKARAAAAGIDTSKPIDKNLFAKSKAN
ncbi:MAG: hypothetical protein Q8O25_02705 [Sulfurisoma sp.]|nr:hypothetical protein [Sulfurisoma sp.]